MILAGQLLLADDAAGRCRFAPGWVRVEDDTIAEVVEGELPDRADIGDRHTLIAPGLIDAHLHLPQFDMIGAHGIPLLQWLDQVTFPAEQKWEDVEQARGMTQRVIGQLLRHGTTGMCAFATVHHESSRSAIEVARRMGMRGVIGQVLMDRQSPEKLCRGAARLLDEAERLGELFPPTERLAAAITPRFAVACSEELLAGAGELAARQGAMVQSHLAETVRECDLVRQLFDGRSYVEVYRQTGLLGARSVLGHGVHLSEQDRLTLAQTGTAIAHCPTANTFLRSGTMDRAALLAAKIPVALGSDIGAGYERSMVRVARSMIQSAAALGGGYPSAAAGWYAITAGNARALGWHDAGRLRHDTPADLLVIRPTIPWLQDSVDPLSMLMFAWDDRWLERTMLQGRWVHPYAKPTRKHDHGH